MRSVDFNAVRLAIGLLAAAGPATAGVTVRSASESNGRVVVELVNGTPSRAVLTTFLVAIGTSGTYSATFRTGPAVANGAAPASVAVDTLSLDPPFEFRGARILQIEASIPANLPVSHVTIDYTPATDVRDGSTVDPLVKEMVVNRSVFPIVPRSGTPDPWFSLSSHWVKLTVSQRGIYSVTGADLNSMGIALSSIDPATLRVYTLGARMEPRDLNDPTGTWTHGPPVREVAIRVEAGSDGTFDPGDRVVFYGLPTSDWADYFGAAPDTVYYQHERAATNVYYLEWGGSLPGSPLRMADTPAAPIGAADRTTCRQRDYREEDVVQDFNYGGDGWVWLDIGSPAPRSNVLTTVDVSQLVTSRPQTFRTVALAPYVGVNDTTGSNTGHHATYEDYRSGQNVVVGNFVWNASVGQLRYEDGLPVRISSSFLTDGANRFALRVSGDLNPKDKMLFAWFSLFYERRIVASGDAIGFDSPDTTATMNFRASGFGSTGTLTAFDVTDPWAPAAMSGIAVGSAGAGRQVRFSAAIAGQRRHYWVATVSSYRKPGMTRFTPVDLRAETNGPNMVIVCYRDFRAVADRLRAYRLSRLPLYTNPVIRVVTTDDVFDNFSGGLPDPMAIRNYLKFLYDNYADANGNPRLGYVVLLGDANDDFRNNTGARPDFVPSNLYLTVSSPYAFSTDDWYADLNPSDQVPGHAVPDIALGRIPAESAQEAQLAVDKEMGYELDAPRGAWRNRAILVADDELSSFEGACETEWTDESEAITYYHMPNFVDVHKIYLTEYKQFGAVKPQSRLDFLEQWNAGALLINYIGHGSSVQMADEQVFLGSDTSQLDNGLKLPVLMAFSCTIGDFANTTGKSLSEKLVMRDGGGAIATITASQESYPGPNQRLAYAVYDRFLPEEPTDALMPLGVGLVLAKASAAASTNFVSFQEENTWKYNLLGDPALTLDTPRREIHFDSEPADTLIAGARRSLRGRVLSNGATDTGFHGTVEVTVREPDVRRTYTTRCNPPFPLRYLVPGGVIYQGSADVTGGQFEISFRVPRLAATGTLAFATAYADGGNTDAGATIDSVLTIVPPTPADSLALRPIDGPPHVDLGFKSGLKSVKPGDTVRAFVRDPDGINILSTTNEGKQAILIDKVPIPIDVNQFFTFDHGGVDTSGVLLYPLPDLNAGHHRIIYKVSDSFGATKLDTLQFDVLNPLEYTAQAVFNYPNPFKTTTQFLFRISNRASIKLEIFTVSGKRVRRLDTVREAGQAWIEWDGRDAVGDDIANGTYLYVATVDFVGLDRPPVVLRGKLSKIR